MYKKNYYWQASLIEPNNLSSLLAMLPPNVEAMQFTKSGHYYQVWGTALPSVNPEVIVASITGLAFYFSHKQNMIE
jgi:hypothetical protein